MAKSDLLFKEFSHYINYGSYGGFPTYDALLRELLAAKLEIENKARAEGFEPHGTQIQVYFELDYGCDDYSTCFDGIRLAATYQRPLTTEELLARDAAKDKRKQAALKRKLTTEQNRKKKLTALEREQTRINAEIASLREKLTPQK